MSGGGAPAIVVEGISHRFDGREALSAVSFSCGPGVLVALLGPNGGGKTTLFRILATLLRPLSGDARILGRSILTQAGAVRSALGVVFQKPSLDPKLTVHENLRHHGHLYGLSGPTLRARAAAAMTALGVADRSGDRVGTLSGGLARRVELAKCLVHEPEVLLLDEPSTGLDPNARRDFLDHLLGLRRQGRTVLLTTHFMEEAERCDLAGILHAGRLVAFDEPARLKKGIGGEVVVLRCPDPESLRGRLGERLGRGAVAVDGTLRLERPDGHLLMRELIETFPSEITSVTWGQPTLDDVFVRLTGRHLHDETEGAA